MTERVELRIRVTDLDDDAAASSIAERAVGLDYQRVGARSGDIASSDEQLVDDSVFVITARATVGAQFIKDWWAERDGGMVIDQRAGASADIYRDVRERYGHVIVFPVDGGSVKVSVEEAPKDAVERWISEVVSRAHRSADDISRLVAGTPVAEKIVVVVDPG